MDPGMRSHAGLRFDTRNSAFRQPQSAVETDTLVIAIIANRRFLSEGRPFVLDRSHPGTEGEAMKGEIGHQVVPDHAERRRPMSPHDFWMARLESALGSSECRVLELSPGNATVQIDHPVAENQAVTLIMERLGELSGVVAWQRDGCIGIRIIEHRPSGGSLRTPPGGWTAARAEPAPPRQASRQPEARERNFIGDADPAAPAPEGIAVQRWGGDPDLLA